jgi:hypothetical protein
MRIEMYSALDRRLYVHDDDISNWIERPWVMRGERVLSLCDLADDPSVRTVAGLFLFSSDDATQRPEVRDGWLHVKVGSADRFLDEFTVADWRFEGEEDSKRVPLREADVVGVITGPVDTIVIFDFIRSWPVGRRELKDHSRAHPRGPGSQRR